MSGNSTVQIPSMVLGVPGSGGMFTGGWYSGDTWLELLRIVGTGTVYPERGQKIFTRGVEQHIIPGLGAVYCTWFWYYVLYLRLVLCVVRGATTVTGLVLCTVPVLYRGQVLCAVSTVYGDGSGCMYLGLVF
jgi:hypothetical protein